MRMGGGGLLAEIPSRPLPRAEASAEPAAPKPVAKPPRRRAIAALLLAAGQSRADGRAEQAARRDRRHADGGAHARKGCCRREPGRSSRCSATRPTTVDAALGKLPVERVRNPEFAEGLSTSLKCGLAALPTDLDGVVVCLGDMPLIAGARHRPADRRVQPVRRPRDRRPDAPRQARQPGVVGQAIFRRDGGAGRRCRRQAPDRRARRTGLPRSRWTRRRARRYRHAGGARRFARQGQTERGVRSPATIDAVRRV